MKTKGKITNVSENVGNADKTIYVTFSINNCSKKLRNKIFNYFDKLELITLSIKKYKLINTTDHENTSKIN